MIRGTPTQLQALDALVAAGTRKEAASRLGVSEQAIGARLGRLRRRNKATTVQLAYRHGREGT